MLINNALYVETIIKETCMCDKYPFEPYFYIEKLGYTGVYLFFLFLTSTHRLCFGAKIRKNGIHFLLKIFIVLQSNLCILHVHVFVMINKNK